MADQGDTETLVLESVSRFSSLPPVGDCKDVKDETVLFDDTWELDSPLEESQLEKLDFDTIVVDDPDSMNNVELQTKCEYEEEVVLDSEDEGISRTKLASSVDKFSFDKPGRRVKGNGMNSQKMHLYILDEQAEYLVPYSCGSIDDQHATDSLEGDKKLTSNFETSDLGQDNKFAKVNCSGSQEPGGSSQANALNFVDHFLSLNDVALSPRTDSTKTMKEKSPHVSSAKGIHSLAKRIVLGTPNGEKEIFKWDDGDQQGEADFFRNKSEVRHQKARLFDSSGSKSSANKDKQKQEFANLEQEIMASAPSKSSFPVHGSKEICSMVQVSDMKIDNNSIKELEEDRYVKISEELQQFDACSISDSLDMCDVGFNTQIAAEAMEALAYAPPANCATGDAHYDTWDNLEVSGVNLTWSKAHAGHPYPQESVCFNVGDVSVKRKQRTGPVENFQGTSNSSQKHFENQDIETKIRRTKSLAGRQSIARICAHASEISERSPKVIKHGKVGRVKRQNNSKACENSISSIAAGHISPVKGNDQVVLVSHQTMNHVIEGGARMCQDQFDSTGERTNNDMAGGIITYKRRRSLSANPPLASKFPELRLGSSARTSNNTNEPEQTSVDVDSLTSYLRLDSWNYPKRKRTPHKVQSNSGRANRLFASLVTADEKVSAAHSKRRQKLEENVRTACLNAKSKSKSWDYPTGKRSFCRVGNNSNRPNNLCSSFVIVKEKESDSHPKKSQTRSNYNTTDVCAKGALVVTSKNLSDKCHNKTRNRSLPKSSSRERVGLAAPKSKPEFTWKDLRRRRVMTYVRVLFSQHLGDVIIKKQKKILTRLGASVASSLMDATHFVANRFVRTRNMLEAIALGKPVVTHLWLESCSQASSFIDEISYILRDTKKEKEIGFRLPVSLAQAMQNPLLKGRRVFITSSIKPDKEMLACLVKAVHGQVVESWQIPLAEDPNLQDDLLILSCAEDHAICLPFLKKGAAVYESELLLNGIVIQKLEYERHQLFGHQGMRNRPKSRSRW
ncbi:hypothetical protein HS088_TW17G00239 [Tripterygium wilfordii]|uniref:BRCT domain-containing protein n=2 Tax=Tripterygium wilfordii TaxID=458696 RepID=A0A7J7CEZ5_TRIWF|nr:hypothetical protein HS088_TW17G00239 [Tripterygium wilfordii]